MKRRDIVVLRGKYVQGSLQIPKQEVHFCSLPPPSSKNSGDRVMIFSEVHKTRLYTPINNFLLLVYFKCGLSITICKESFIKVKRNKFSFAAN